MTINRYIFPAAVFVLSSFSCFAQDNSQAAVHINAGTECLQLLKLSEGDSHGNQNVLPNQERGPGSSGGNFSPTAAPGNNDCVNATTLTVNAACVNGTNKEATVQAGENSACQGSITKSVWYKFVATAASMFVEIELTATSGCYLSSAVYSGSCLPSTAVACEDAASGPNLNIHNLTGLNVGTTYYIQVGYTGGMFCGNNNNAGTGADFCIKVGTPQNCASCATPCGPICVYPTTPTVAQVTSTCTAYPLRSRINSGQSKSQCYTFTAVAASFSLQMIINAVGCSGGNVSTFNWQLYHAACGAAVQSGNLSNLNATGLTIGSAYVLCYSWTATCQHNSVYPYIVATSPLPVSWLYFDGKQTEQEVFLKWSTASEINNAYFSIERSRDGVEFESIGHVTGAGTSSQTSTYRYSDIDPQSGVNYYRIVQVDYDGQSTKSGTIAVRYNENFSVKFESNPVEDILQITIKAESSANIRLQVVNDGGETVREFSKHATKGTNRFVIPVDGLTQGMYFLKTECKQGTTWTRFLKL